MSLSCRCCTGLLIAMTFSTSACRRAKPESFTEYTLDYATPTDPALQTKVEALDVELRGRYGIMPEEAAVGVLDLRKPRLAMVHPDRIEAVSAWLTAQQSMATASLVEGCRMRRLRASGVLPSPSGIPAWQ